MRGITLGLLFTATLVVFSSPITVVISTRQYGGIALREKISQLRDLIDGTQNIVEVQESRNENKFIQYPQTASQDDASEVDDQATVDREDSAALICNPAYLLLNGCLCERAGSCLSGFCAPSTEICRFLSCPGSSHSHTLYRCARLLK